MTGRQHFRAVMYGIAFWLVAALTVKHASGLFDGKLINLLVLVISIPLCWLSIRISERACGIPAAAAFEANAIAIIPATFADAIGLTFLPDTFYAGVSFASQFGAAWILWGVGWILLFARLRSRTMRA